MNRRFLALACALIPFAQSGCAVAPERGRASGAALEGGWVFNVNTGKHVAQGSMTLVADGSSYRGTLTTDQGSNVLTIRSLMLNGAEMQMIVDSPQGVVSFKGVLGSDARSFEGVVTYHSGQRFPMSGAKR